MNAPTHAVSPPSLLLSVLPYVLASIVFSALPLFALAQNNPPTGSPACEYLAPPRNGSHPPLPMEISFQPPLPAQLDLTDEQQDKVFALMHDKAPVLFENEKTVRKTRQELQQISRTDRFDAAKARSLAEAHGKALAELTYLQTVIQAQVWAVLTEVQRKQLSKLSEHSHRQ
jgi:Spy/CpxP family protein refolding chaperone